MKAKLHVKTQDGNQIASRMVQINGERCVIGRRGADVTIDDKLSSRQHCLLYPDEDGRVRAKDLDSRNGTFVNGEKIVEVVLRPGDEIKIGNTTLSIVEVDTLETDVDIVRPFSSAPVGSSAAAGMSRPRNSPGMKNWFILDPETDEESEPDPESEEPAPAESVPKKRTK